MSERKTNSQQLSQEPTKSFGALHDRLQYRFQPIFLLNIDRRGAHRREVFENKTINTAPNYSSCLITLVFQIDAKNALPLALLFFSLNVFRPNKIMNPVRADNHADDALQTNPSQIHINYLHSFSNVVVGN